jgi:hypothetical protein
MTRLLIATLLVSTAIAGQAQSPQSVTVLTVPEDRLPEGCRLEPVVPNAVGAARFSMYRVRATNPWVSTPPEPVASVRQLVENRSVGEDGLTGPALHARLQIGVAEAYGARYLAADSSKIEVHAVRYTDPKLTSTAALIRLDPHNVPRIVVGAIAAHVFRSVDWRRANASGEACLKAVRDYIGSLKAPDPAPPWSRR